MSDYGDRLTLADVQALISRSNTPSDGVALAAQNALRETVSLGVAAFADQDAFTLAQQVVEAADVRSVEETAKPSELS